MSIDDRIRQLKQELDRVRPSHPSRLPSWVAAAAVAAGLTISAGACSRERHTENPANDRAAMDSDMEPGPAIGLYAGPPPPQEMDAPPPAPAYAGPPDGDLYGGPPVEVETAPPPPMDLPPVPAYDGPPMREVVAPPVPAYGVAPVPPMKPVMKAEEEKPAPMKTPMLRPSEPVTDYGGPFL